VTRFIVRAISTIKVESLDLDGSLNGSLQLDGQMRADIPTVYKRMPSTDHVVVYFSICHMPLTIAEL
jgi:hypothetical protein